MAYERQLQLTLDGREVEIEAAPRAHSPFTTAQRAILRLVAERETITSSDAGRIVHAHRVPPCHRCNEGVSCGFVSSDGRDALKRLQARGLVRRVITGVWAAA